MPDQTRWDLNDPRRLLAEYDSPPRGGSSRGIGCGSELLAAGIILGGIALICLVLFLLQLTGAMRCMPMVNC